ncbi:MAG: gliding motility-associated C-terminal domain-containing protein [Bacteroidetes bacterium]|nr:gliding motility-associated C-terminal domain-containing protein [Bacteroidota bacterium]
MYLFLFMRMNHTATKQNLLFLFFIFFLHTNYYFSQKYSPDLVNGISGNTNIPELLNGNGTLGNTYNYSACGLGFEIRHKLVTDRALSLGHNGSGLPAVLTFSLLPTKCYSIEKAYIWFGGSYSSAPPSNLTLNLVNPQSQSTNFSASLVGSLASGKCWQNLGETGTCTYRADVTSAISSSNSNGNYTLNVTGYPSTAQLQGLDGFTMIIIFRDLNSNQNGTLVIDDGLVTRQTGNSFSHTISNFSVCATSNAAAFMTVSDLQNNAPTNNVTFRYGSTNQSYPKEFWNNFLNSTTASSGQTAITYSLNTGGNPNNNGDCYSVHMAGYYYTNTVCATCPQAAFNTNASTQNPLCNAQCNGSIQLTPSGGTSPYTYRWNNNATTSARTSLCSGVYSVSITDNRGCTVTNTITVTQPAVLGGSITVSNVTCNGSGNGGAIANGTGGTPNYNFNWGSGYTTNNSNPNLNPGTYTVTIRDANNCTTNRTYTITQPTAITSTLSTTGATCNATATGSVSASTSGGVPTYQYNWGAGYTTSANQLGVTAGNYNVIIKDANNCTITKNYTITEPTAISSTITGNNIICNGQTNGSATISASGSNGGFTYTWSNSTVGSSVNNLSANTYSVTIRDSKGCTSSKSITITQPSAITISLTTQQAYCGQSNGSINSSVTGGNSPYTFAWSNSANTQNINNVSGGAYTLVVTDAGGCTKQASATVTNSTGGTANISSSSNVSCNGGSNGSAVASITGGTFPFSYTWSNNVFTQANNNLTAGTYTVTIRDANGCSSQTSVTITQPSAISATLSAVSSICTAANGSITTAVSGGVPSYSFLWNNSSTNQNINSLASGTYTVTVRDANNCTKNFSATVNNTGAGTASIVSQSNILCFGGNNGIATATITGGTSPYNYNWSNSSTSNTINNLTAGVYTLTIGDANGCSSQTSVTITQPSQLSGSITSNTLNCFGDINGTATALGSGGTNPYTYSWSNSSTQQTISGVSAGFYSVLITDNNNCTTTKNVTILQPSDISATITSTNVSCFGGNNGASIASASGGTSPYNYSWSNNNLTQNTNNLSANLYSVIVLDNNGCSKSFSVNITQPAALSATLNTTSSSCLNNNGSISSVVSGGISPYTYSWSNNATTSSISNLTSSVYSLQITDANNCSTSFTQTLSNSGAPSISILSQNNVNCFGSTNGSASISVSGGSNPYTYSWSNGNNTSIATGLTANTYTVFVTDAGGCSTQSTITITQPGSAITGTLQTSISSCVGNTNGIITSNFSGGSMPYNYLWNTSATTSSLNNLTTGVYTLTLSDNNGCSLQLSTLLGASGGGTASISAQSNVSCFGGTNGSATASVIGGLAPFTYNWSTNSTSSQINNLAPGSYIVLTTDANGCTSLDTAIISQPNAPLSATASITSSVTCNGAANGIITVATAGGTSGYIYTLSPGNTISFNGIFNGVAAGAYTILVTDANGCTSSATAFGSIIIPQPNPINVSANISANASCFGTATGIINASANGGVPNYLYSLAPSGQTSTTGIFTNIVAGTYTVIVTDNANCTSTNNAVVTITQPTAITFAANTTVTNESCPQTFDGSINTVASGGAGGFSYSLLPAGATNNNGTFSNLSAGSYTIVVTDATSCTAVSQAFAITNQSEGKVIAENDETSVEFNTSASIDISANDTTSNATITIVQNPINGSIISISNGVVNYKPNEGFSGNDSLTYVVCDQFCTLACDTAKVYLNVLPELIFSIPNGFSPDGDGINDKFVIKNIDRFGDNKLEIYNRWGVLIFEASSYKNEWDGTTNNSSAVVLGDGKVVSGTYYYVLTLKDNNEIHKGYLEIRR